MMANDPLADALNAIKTHEMFCKPACEVKPSKLVRETLKILQRKGFIGDFEFVDDGKNGYFKIKLLGRVNQCSAVKPRFAVKRSEWNEWESKYLPGVGFGMFVVSTPDGLMTNDEAKEKGLGGRLIAYVY
ncbi:TPA: 30S ribosomal protein S8 [Candidatus Micrarchaeota archaeon]|nr:30S ribosomal protein S8 [Candidatus Micrarchaeota archaeon]HIH29822.1 30S ribosomal protein S8 [Candidatus Micrarchaeota archaeon]